MDIGKANIDAGDVAEGAAGCTVSPCPSHILQNTKLRTSLVEKSQHITMVSAGHSIGWGLSDLELSLEASRGLSSGSTSTVRT